MSTLKIAALDEADLTIVSAHVQDAVLKVGDMKWMASEKRFVMALNRFAWEKKTGLFRRRHERRRSVLHFDRVFAVRSSGFSPDRPADVLSLLAVRFIAGVAPAGTVELVFSGGASARLDVECIEARLSDLGAAWAAGARPRHDP